MTKSGAINALNTYTSLAACNANSKLKDSIIYNLNKSVLLKTFTAEQLQASNKAQAQQIKLQEKALFWRRVEIWIYRAGIVAGTIYLISN